MSVSEAIALVGHVLAAVFAGLRIVVTVRCARRKREHGDPHGPNGKGPRLG